MTTQADPIRIPAHRAQIQFMNERSVPYIGFVGGVGSGKSFASAMKLWKWSMLEKGVYGMYAPQFKHLDRVLIPIFLKLAGSHVKNQKDGCIDMISGSRIWTYSLEDEESARGPSLRGAIWDEASLCKQKAFDILIARLRYEGKQGWLACSFTPKGLQHWTAEVFNNPDRTDVKCFHATSQQNPFNPPDFVSTIRRQYTKAFSQQELDGKFVTLGGSLMRREWFKVVTETPPLFSVMRYWDMASTLADGNNDPDWTAGAKVGRTKDGRWIILDMRHARLTPGGNEMLVQYTTQEDGRGVAVGMEEEGGASGKSLIDHYRRNLLVGYNFRGYRPTGDKAVRAMPLAAAAEAGNVLVLQGAWNKDLLDEVESFGPDCPHDDQVDAISGAVNCLAPRFIKPSVGFGMDSVERITELDYKIREGLNALGSDEERAEMQRMMV